MLQIQIFVIWSALCLMHFVSPTFWLTKDLDRQLAAYETPYATDDFQSYLTSIAIYKRKLQLLGIYPMAKRIDLTPPNYYARDLDYADELEYEGLLLDILANTDGQPLGRSTKKYRKPTHQSRLNAQRVAKTKKKAQPKYKKTENVANRVLEENLRTVLQASLVPATISSKANAIETKKGQEFETETANKLPFSESSVRRFDGNTNEYDVSKEPTILSASNQPKAANLETETIEIQTIPPPTLTEKSNTAIGISGPSLEKSDSAANIEISIERNFNVQTQINALNLEHNINITGIRNINQESVVAVTENNIITEVPTTMVETELRSEISSSENTYTFATPPSNTIVELSEVSNTNQTNSDDLKAIAINTNTDTQISELPLKDEELRLINEDADATTENMFIESSTESLMTAVEGKTDADDLTDQFKMSNAATDTTTESPNISNADYATTTFSNINEEISSTEDDDASPEWPGALPFTVINPNYDPYSDPEAREYLIKFKQWTSTSSTDSAYKVEYLSTTEMPKAVTTVEPIITTDYPIDTTTRLPEDKESIFDSGRSFIDNEIEKGLPPPRRSDVAIEYDYDGDYDEPPTVVTTGNVPEPTVYSFDEIADLDRQKLIPHIPVLIEQLRLDRVSNDERSILQQIFGEEFWSLILAEVANNTSLAEMTETLNRIMAAQDSDFDTDDDSFGASAKRRPKRTTRTLQMRRMQRRREWARLVALERPQISVNIVRGQRHRSHRQYSNY